MSLRVTDDSNVVHRGIAGPDPRSYAHRRATYATYAIAALAFLLIASMLMVHLAARAGGAGVSRCEGFAASSSARGAEVTGSGRRIVVIGDSYAAGLGLDDPSRSWPSRLPGRIHVAGYSGSGFSEGASPCQHASFADRARAALSPDVDLVVVEGGLNDVDQSPASITAGFVRLMRIVSGHQVVIVGPPLAPSRAAAVPPVDDLLASLAAAYGAAYIRTSVLGLAYLPDQLHLTPAAHDAFGDFVADEIASSPTAVAARPTAPRAQH